MRRFGIAVDGVGQRFFFDHGNNALDQALRRHNGGTKHTGITIRHVGQLLRGIS